MTAPTDLATRTGDRASRVPVTGTGPRSGPARRRRFGYRPGLDGLRALCVIAVIAFHQGHGWFGGGFLGVSSFFTLSGFLITTIVLSDRADADGRTFALGFWARRVRRLVPAGCAAVVLALLVALAIGDATVVDRTRADALAALGYVANWRQIFAGLSYAELFAEPSPLVHMWSLSIEEQFYLLVPPAILVLRRRGDLATRLGVAAAAALVASVAVSLLVTDPDRAYYGTDTRSAEILLGVVVACLHHRTSLTRLGTDRARTAAAAVAGAILLVLWTTTTTASGWLHPWALLLNAAATAVVVVVALGGTAGHVLSWEPLVWVGARSYGIYLYHWPVALWFEHVFVRWPWPVVDAMAPATTLGLAALSHRLLEQPIRNRTRAPADMTVVAGMLSLVGTALVVFVVATTLRPEPLIDFDSARAVVTTPDPTAVSAPDPAGGPDPDGGAADGPPPRLAVFGDSTALMLQQGLAEWSDHFGRFTLVSGFTELGCGVGRDGSRFTYGEWRDTNPQCAFDRHWPTFLANGRPDIAVVQLGLWDIVERRVSFAPEPLTIGDPAYDVYLVQEIRAATDLLLGTADEVVWILQPPPVRSTRPDDDAVFERMASWNALVVEALRDRDRVGLVDLAGWFAGAEVGHDDLSLRPDGTHVSTATSVRVAAWLAPAILAAVDGDRRVGADEVEAQPVPGDSAP